MMKVSDPLYDTAEVTETRAEQKEAQNTEKSISIDYTPYENIIKEMKEESNHHV